jgi:hypothetical protein
MKGYTKVREVWVEDAIFSTFFNCDYRVCKGICCYGDIGIETEGAPLTIDEAKEFWAKRKTIAKYGDAKHKAALLSHPIARTDVGDGDCTALVGEDCVFCGTHGCAIKETYVRTRAVSVDVPVSCELYPLYVDDVEGALRLNLGHLFDKYCKCAYEKGQKEHIHIIDSMSRGIVRYFNVPFLDELRVKAGLEK